jgi:hypothetical protein
VREDEFMSSVVDLAHVFRWMVHHGRPAWTEKGWRTPIQGEPGFPDLVLVRWPRVIFAELKSKQGKMSDAQAEWIAELKKCPAVEIYLWRPDDWEEIKNILMYRT